MSPPYRTDYLVRSTQDAYQLVCGKCGRRSFGSLKSLARFPCACGAVCCGKPPRQVKGCINIHSKISSLVAQAVRRAKKRFECPYTSALQTPATPATPHMSTQSSLEVGTTLPRGIVDDDDEVAAVSTVPTGGGKVRRWINVLEVRGVLCTEFNPGMWNKTNSLKVFLDAFESKGLLEVGAGGVAFPFFTVNGQAFSHIRIHDPECVHTILCEYMTRSVRSTAPDRRVYSLFNDLGFKSKAENFKPERKIKGKKDVYWWDLATWTSKAARSLTTLREAKHLLPRLTPVKTKTFPSYFYEFGVDKFVDQAEKEIVFGIISNI